MFRDLSYLTSLYLLGKNLGVWIAIWLSGGCSLAPVRKFVPRGMLARAGAQICTRLNRKMPIAKLGHLS